MRCVSVSTAARSHVNVSAKRRPALPNESTTSRDPAMRRIAAAIARASPCGTRKPVSPSRTLSRMPGELEATTGVPQAAASMLVIPHPSLGEANSSDQARRSNATFWASSMKPRNRTRAVRSSEATSRSSSGR